MSPTAGLLAFIATVTVALVVTVAVLASREALRASPVRRSFPDSQHRALAGPPVPAESLRATAIGLPKRYKTHFSPLKTRLAQEGWDVTFHEGVNGKLVDWRTLDLAPRYRAFFDHNQAEREAGRTQVDYRGHLGATLAHLQVLRHVAALHDLVPHLILEDDAVVEPGFRHTWPAVWARLFELDPDWEVVLLGSCCNYRDHFYCKLNDHEALSPVTTASTERFLGLTRVHYWFGGWAYVVRDSRTAAKCLSFFEPISWHIDLTLADQALEGNLRVYACLPPLVNHPGRLRWSSFDQELYGQGIYTTDTNH